MDLVPTFELLVTGLSSRLMTIPVEIICLMKRYYTSYHIIPMNLFIVKGWTTSGYPTVLYNISSDKTYQVRQTINFGNAYLTQMSISDGAYCVINNNPLPRQMQTIFPTSGFDKIFVRNDLSQSIYQIHKSFPRNIINSNKWSMIAQLGKQCELTAFHLDLVAENDNYGAFKFKLPSFPVVCNGKPTTCVFHQRNKLLYALNPDCSCYYYVEKRFLCGHGIYSLDLKDYDLKWKYMGGIKQLLCRYNTSTCIVDDAFIAILGGAATGDASQITELYALNGNQSILLDNMCKKRKNGMSLYHRKLYGIIIGDKQTDDGIEWYDINKDKWFMIFDKSKMKEISEIKKIFISKMNPNILCIIAKKERDYSSNMFWNGDDDNDIVICQLDLRTNKSNNSYIDAKWEFQQWWSDAVTMCL